MAEHPLGGLLLADGVALYIGLSLVLGSLASDAWLRDTGSPWSNAVRSRSRAVRRAGLGVTLAGLIGALWLQAAVMGDVPLWQAGPTAGVLLRDTHFGHVALAGGAAWCVLAAASWRVEPRGRVRPGLIGSGLAVLVWSRSAVAHAGSQGDFSFDVAIHSVHMLAACLWLGMVLFAALLKLPPASAPMQQRLDAVRWVTALSSTATVALVLVVFTGAFRVWRTGPGLVALVSSAYGLALCSKVALVGLAAVLGGFNRFRVLPALFDDLRVDIGSALLRPWRQRLKTVLWGEALVLLVVLVLAVVLAGTEPPSP
jgi:putative copper resistance protein D